MAMKKRGVSRRVILAVLICLIAGCPLFVTREHLWGPALDLAVTGNRAYVCAGRNLLVLNIKDPRAPAKINQIEFPDVTTGVELSDRFAFVSVTGRSDRAFDISDPERPVEKVLEPSSPRRRKKTGEVFEAPYTYLNDTCVFYVLRDAGLPDLGPSDTPPPDSIIGQAVLDADRNVCARSAVFVRPPLAFAAVQRHLYDFELAVIDVSQPTKPFCLGRSPIKKGAHSFPRAVVSANGYAFVAATYGGVLIIDVSDPGRPYIAAIFRTSSQN
jgi:hypothetical protein